MTRRQGNHGAEAGPGRRRLRRVGVALLLVYGAVAWLSFSFRYGEGHRERPILLVLGLLTLAWAAYALALATVLRRRERTCGGQGGRLLLVVGFAAAYRLVLLPSVPIQEIDYYRYLWDGRVLLAGVSPFRLAPAEVDRLGPSAGEGAPAGVLWRLSRSSEAVRTIFERVHHREVPTVYPPMAQVVFAASALVTPAGAPLWAHVLVLKAILIGFDLGTLLLLVLLLRRLNLPEEWSLAYGWCPLVLKEVANTGHLDAIAVFFTALAITCLVGIGGRRSRGDERARPRLGMAALGLAVLAKSYPIILLPLVSTFLAARIRRRAVVPLLVFAAVIAAGYLPFLAGPVADGGESAHHPWSGLGTFLSRWQKNDFLFMLVHENLRPPLGDRPDHWFVVVPAAWRSSLHRAAGFGPPGWTGPDRHEPAFLLAQAVMGLVLMALVARWCVRVARRPGPEELLRSVALVLVWGWLLSSTPHPWYLTWCIPFLVFERRRSWFLLPGLAMAYYLRFALEYHALGGGEAAVEAALHRFDYGAVWWEYLPFFAALLAESCWSQRPRRRTIPSGWRNRSGRVPQLPSDGAYGRANPDPSEGPADGVEGSTV
ncbi:hypothetical protein [Tautonia sociabilis]|uniref:DUF2029 domain-containing protein n=1 Tax=Tautonia sociabilis TaxID=2080755 RepID=A0A432MKK5_9BACT|nr:hypothetical protein [Tautonia sociabilis]RUL87953.1 hypothetical protein TsocGM_09515 [Tautonia sociabilis]